MSVMTRAKTSVMCAAVLMAMTACSTPQATQKDALADAASTAGKPGARVEANDSAEAAARAEGKHRAALADAALNAHAIVFSATEAGVVSSVDYFSRLLAIDPYIMLEDKKFRGPRDLVITAVGDVSQPTKKWSAATIALKGDVFLPTQHLLDSGDLVFMNLENPISEREPKVKKEFSFTSDPGRLDWYIDAGFNLYSLSNNHIADAYQDGIDDTLRHLREYSERKDATIFWAGAASTYEEAEAATWVTVEGKDLKIAFFSTGFSNGKNVSKFWSKTLVTKITEAKKTADVVIVSVHAGKEYKHTPQAQLKTLYRGWVDAGADVVIGHHPHVIRPVEAYKGGIILHSLGNYVFASRTRRHKEHGARMYGLVARVIIRDGKPAGVELVPTWVNNAHGWKLESGEELPRADFVPRLVTGEFADIFFEDFEQWTEEAGLTPSRRVRDAARVDAEAPTGGEI